jgi:hypothetical protein
MDEAAIGVDVLPLAAEQSSRQDLRRLEHESSRRIRTMWRFGENYPKRDEADGTNQK